MGWARDAVDALTRGERVTVRPRGGSMRGRVEDGQEVTLAPPDAPPAIDDVVLVRWRGSSVLLHLVKDIDADGRLLIGNALGKINGWVDADALLGVLVDSDD